MNVSIVGPEGSGKTTFANFLAKKGAHNRPINFIGKMKSEFNHIEIKDFKNQKFRVNIFDDINAVLDSYDILDKETGLKEPVIMSKNYNNLNIFIFHSVDDAIKFFFRQSRYIYISTRYRDSAYLDNKFIKGITPEIFGKAPYEFYRFKRY